MVLLSSVQAPGRTVTIRDSVGYLSSPQSILVSTTRNVRFLDGTTRAEIKGAYSYLTVQSYSPALWTKVNSFGFPVEQTVGSFQSLTTSSMLTSQLYASSLVSTAALQAGELVVNSSLQGSGPAFFSSLIVGATLDSAFAYTTLAAGNSLGVSGSTSISSSLTVGSNLQVGGSFSTGGSLFVGGSISSLGPLYVQGSITGSGNISTAGTLTTNGLTVTGGVTVGSEAVIFTDLYVGNSIGATNAISTAQIRSDSLSVTSSIELQGKAIVSRTSDILITSPISVAGSLSTNNLVASNAIVTSSLAIGTTIDARTASLFQLSSTQISNPMGSLTISSIAAASLVASNSVATSALGTSSLTASTVILGGGDLAIPGTGIVSFNTGLFSTIFTNAVFTDTAVTNQFSTTTISVSSLTVTGQINASSISSFVASNAFINNSQGSIQTLALSTRALTTSSLTLLGSSISSSQPVFTINASSIYMDSLSLSSLTVSTATTSIVTAKTIKMGSIVDSNAPIGAYWSQKTLGSPNTTPINMSVMSGVGDYFRPLMISNVKPAGIGPGQLYPVRIDLSVSVPTTTGEFVGNKGVGTSYFFWDSEPNSYLNFNYNYSVSGTTLITTQLGLNGSNQTTPFEVPAESQNIFLPNSGNLTITGELAGNASVNIVFGNASNALVTFAEPSTLIEMQNGRIVWPFAFNTTTIENSLNDITTRNLYYFGSLNFTSDPRIKENIRDADLEACVDLVKALPLRSYTMKPTYCSTFGVSGAPRLGVLANELGNLFPESVRETTLSIPGVEAIKTVDTQQLEMAHLGATKYLIAEVSTLKALLKDQKN